MGKMTLRQLLASGVAAGALSLAVGAAAHAEAVTFDFDQPAMPMSAALQNVGRETGVNILVDAGLVKDLRANKLKGQLSADDALVALLDGTGLTIRKTDQSSVMIVRASDPQSGSAVGDGADGTVAALVVTAQKREENIQDVPIAMSAFSQEDLTRSQVAGGPDLMTQIPNMTFTKTNFSSYSIQIRGIGTQAISVTTDPAVAVAFNNTPFIRNRFFEQEFYDLQRVEVLRGPQGTLYGRNATAGVVNLLSAKPNLSTFQSRLSGDVANYGSKRLEGMVNIPLIEDKAALRIAGAWTKRDGYVTNTLTGEQTDGRDLWSTRVTLGLEPSDKLHVNLIWEHFHEKDDRLRSGKQLCHSDPGPSEINGIPVGQSAASIISTPTVGYVSQGCQFGSLYSADSFQMPNGYSLPYYGPLGTIGLPVFIDKNPYAGNLQSRDLREIETHLTPDYEATSDVGELQWTLDLPWNLSLTSETGFNRDKIFSFEDYNRFDTTPNVFDPGGRHDNVYDIIAADGTFCDPQLGCTNRLAGGDLSEARSRQFSQEFRLSSDFDGPFNFNLGANFLRYDTVENYYVFFNTLTMWEALLTEFASGDNTPPVQRWQPGVTDNSNCFGHNFFGPVISDSTQYYNVLGCAYIDPNDIHHLNGQGRNYFLSKNPYRLLSYAAFGEAYYQITPNLKLTAGLRWTVDKKTAPQIPSWLLAGAQDQTQTAKGSYGLPVRKVINQEWREPTGRIALDWKPDLSFTDQTLVYASYVRGYKAGGANPPPPVVVFAGVCPPQCDDFGAPTGAGIVAASLTHPETFKPEFVNAYEIGTKNTVLDGRLTANLSAFYYDYQGYQISQIVDRSAVNLNFDAKVWGAELELDWRPLENLRLGLKGGYENTRVADGMKAIDTMDRTAGKDGWMVFRPFPTLTANCVVPIWLATVAYPTGLCAAYIAGVDPVTYLPYVPNPTTASVSITIPEGYPGYDPRTANNGQGFEKDLSGNALPNAPKFTTTITADYTLPLPHDWLATLHADLYYQSEAWTRIFNTPGYDKLKAYNNVNLAAIFTNDDAGLTVMAYVKNVLDKDNITGAFLNSEDSGLTTNVFLNEPRLYGLRVTKNWSGGTGWIARPHTPGTAYPLTIEFGDRIERLDTPGETVMPFADAFSAALDPRRSQQGDFDWTDAPQLRLIYQPPGSSWKVAGGVRYGKTNTKNVTFRGQEAAGPDVCQLPMTGAYGFIGKARCDPTYVFNGTPPGYFYRAEFVAHPQNRVGASSSRQESHKIADFTVGKDVGLGQGAASVSAGLRYGEFKSSLSGDMNGVPDLNVPVGWAHHDQYPTTLHHYTASFSGEREFKGMGPTLSWEASRRLLGEEETSHVDLDWSVTGGVLFGRQKAKINGEQGSAYISGVYEQYADTQWAALPVQTRTPIDIRRNKSVAVPLVDLSLGLSVATPGVKLSGGYRWERYFNVLDAGFDQHKSFDRTLDGPYLKVAVGFGG